MSTTRATLTPVPMSLDHRIERVRAQLAELATYRGKGSPTRSLQEFDQETEALIAEQLGDGSELLEAYAYAEFGEAGGLVNMTDEAHENADFDSIHHHLVQRGRVLESCIAELEAQRGLEARSLQTSGEARIR